MSKSGLSGKVLFITGASRGIGRSIALRAAKDGAKIVLAAKTKDPHPKLPGTIFSVAEEIEKLGGKALPCAVDVRFEDQVQAAVDNAVKVFGGLDILVNNASAIQLTNTASTSMKSYDLLNTVNARGTFMCSKLCLPFLKKAPNPHILTLSPPLNLNPMWFGNHVAYTISKYGMSMCVLGMAREFRGFGIAVNALWPCTAIYTAATKMLAGGEDFSSQCRTPEIVSDAAYAILTRPAKDPKNTGNFLIDEEVLREEGVTDFDKYAIKPGASLAPDFFLDVPKAQSDDASAGPVSKGSVEAIFDKLQSLLSEEYVKNVGSSFYFLLTDPEPGHWFIDLRAGSGCAGRAETDASEFDCRFELSSDQFVKMFEGKVIPTKAFLAGDLHIDGDVFAAIKLEKLLVNMNK
ncbi:hypothetical protein CRM22_000513 [Opisthorchis felineus]|uniref:Hydroxysteroid dehydrogenase-like protein 2 n=1 Tax=Opisthorchis felineus TaxID=147828 RepID=A0A4S2MKU4_OPIFE|nr:hypothetical protein CRM22_000513 [Opisthorchis felineus]